MFAIVVPGKVSAMSVRFASATEALKKYREMEADGVINIDLRDAAGEPIGAFDLSELAKAEAETGVFPSTLRLDSQPLRVAYSFSWDE